MQQKLDDIRPTFAARNFFEPASPEERKAELLKPEPDFVLPTLTQRINLQINGLEDFASAPAESELKQIAVVKAADGKASQDIAGLCAEVVKFDEAMTAAKVPHVPVP